MLGTVNATGALEEPPIRPVAAQGRAVWQVVACEWWLFLQEEKCHYRDRRVRVSVTKGTG